MHMYLNKIRHLLSIIAIFTTLSLLFSFETLEIAVRGDHNYPPFEFIDDDGMPAGFNVDLIREISREVNLKPDISLGSWDVVRKQLENGEIDVLMGMVYSRERQELVEFSLPHSTLHFTIFGHTSSNNILGFEDFSGERVIVQREGAMHDIIVRNNYDVRLKLVNTPLEGLLLLEQNEADYAVLSHLQSLYLMEEYGLRNIRVVLSPVWTLEYCFAVSKNNHELLYRLNEGLSRLKTTNRFAAIHLKWFPVQDTDRSILHMEIYRYTFWGFIALLAALLAFAFWSLYLKRILNAKSQSLKLQREKSRKIESELQSTQEKYQAVVETLNEGILLTDKAGFISYCNPIIPKWLGLNKDNIIGQSIEQFLADSSIASMQDYLKDKSDSEPLELTWKTDKGELLHSIVNVRALQKNGTVLRGFLWVIMNITHKKNLEKKLSEANKLESLGRMVGGIAHNFNNYLQVLSGYIQLSMRQVNDTKRLHENLQEMDITCQKAKNITAKLQLFSKDKTPYKESVNLNHLIQGILRLVKKLYPETIDIIFTGRDNIFPIYVDPGDIEEVILNLMVNARDAMPLGGELHVSTENVSFSREEILTTPDAHTGDYVVLKIRDTGVGMDKETLAKIFDPFFTTKEEGKGTGLGLSSVYGIVQQYHGFITVNSQPGSGAEFKICVPAYKESQSKGHFDPGQTPEQYNYQHRENIFYQEREREKEREWERERERQIEKELEAERKRKHEQIQWDLEQQRRQEHEREAERKFDLERELERRRDQKKSEQEGEREHIPLRPLKNKETILIAEDDHQVRNVTMEILKSAGYNVLCSEDGEEALKLFHRHIDIIDLVLLDVVMPKKSGKEVYTAIKKNYPYIPCIFFSGYSSAHLTREFIKREKVEVITKPYRIDTLLTKIRDLIDSRRQGNLQKYG